MIAITPKIGGAMATATSRHNSTRQEKLTVLHRAIEIVRNTPQWQTGQIKSVLIGSLYGQKAELYLRNDPTGVNLYLSVNGASSTPFKVGHFDIMTGFGVSRLATEQNYLDWNFRIRRGMS